MTSINVISHWFYSTRNQSPDLPHASNACALLGWGSTHTWYPTQSYYPDTEVTSSCLILLLLSARLGSDKPFIWLDQEPDSPSPTRKDCVLPIRQPCQLNLHIHTGCASCCSIIFRLSRNQNADPLLQSAKGACPYCCVLLFIIFRRRRSYNLGAVANNIHHTWVLLQTTENWLVVGVLRPCHIEGLVTVQRHGDFILLPHYEVRLPSPRPDMPLSHAIPTLS